MTPFLIAMVAFLLQALPAFLLPEPFVPAAAKTHQQLLVIVSGWALVLAFTRIYTVRTLPDQTIALSARVNGSLRNDGPIHAGVVILMVLLIGYGLWFFGGVSDATIAMVRQLFEGRSDELARTVRDVRFESTKAAMFGGAYRGQGAFKAVQTVGWSLITAYAAIRMVALPSIRRCLFVGAVLVAAWLVTAGIGSRGPFLEVIAVGIVAVSLRTPLQPLACAGFVAALLGLAILLSFSSTKGSSLLQRERPLVVASELIAKRVALGNGTNDIAIMELIDDGTWEPRWGAWHARDLMAVMPGAPTEPPLARQLFVQLNPTKVNATTFNSHTLLGLLYADFGAWGVLIGMSAVGVLIAILQRSWFVPTDDPWRIAWIACASYATGALVLHGFTGWLVKLLLSTAIAALVGFLSLSVRNGRLRPAALESGCT
jgi:hypothetical protein